jgi:hypothetical protein
MIDGGIDLRQSDLDSNSALYGGGIFSDSACVTLTEVRVKGSTRGGSVHLVGSNGSIDDCVVDNNSGAGLSAVDCFLSLGNTSIALNRSFQAATIICSTSTITMQNCIIAFNKNGEAFRADEPSIYALFCCDVYGNEGGDWTGSIAQFADQLYNMSVDPRFCDTTTGDFHVAENSPCAPGNSSCGSLVGALGIGCSAIFICGDADGNQEIDIDDIIYVVNFIFLGGDAPYPIESADADCSDAVDIDDVVYLINYIFTNGHSPCDPDGDSIPDC